MNFRTIAAAALALGIVWLSACAANPNGLPGRAEEPTPPPVEKPAPDMDGKAPLPADEPAGTGEPKEIRPNGLVLLERSEETLPPWTSDRYSDTEESFVVVGKASHLGSLYPAQLKAMEDAVRDILVRSLGSADGVEVVSEWVNDGDGNRRVKLVAKLPVKQGVIEVFGFHLEKIYYETWKHEDQTLFVSWMQVSWRKSIFQKVLSQISQ